MFRNLFAITLTLVSVLNVLASSVPTSPGLSTLKFSILASNSTAGVDTSKVPAACKDNCQAMWTLAACEVPVCRCTDEISDGLAQCFKCVLRVDKGSTAMEAQGMLDAFVAQCKSMDMKVKSQSIPGANMAVPLQRGMVTTVLAVSAVLLLL